MPAIAEARNPRTQGWSGRITRVARYGIIADDLTGACDAGVQFAQHGLDTVVWLSTAEAPDCDVLVLSTASRGNSADGARRKVQGAMAALGRAGATLVFKKIDSTLRGNIVAEIEACGFEETWVAPAYPAMGRQLIGGELAVGGVRRGVRLEPRPGLRVFDAQTQDDLVAVARDAFALPKPPLLAGSAGLAIEVAKRLGRPEPYLPPVAGRPGPAVLYIGSMHPVTIAQVKYLRECRDVHDYRLVPVRTLEGKLAGPVARYQARSAAGVIMSGGDTAALVCRALHADGIRLVREALPGIAYGVIMGGTLDGTPVVTKAGGFGHENAFALLVDALRKGFR